MLKKDLLEDIQKKIDKCNEHLSQNPYPPALKRVGYILNNKCKGRDLPFYINAIYNQEQLKLNTDESVRNKFIYSSDEEFKLSDIEKFSDITLHVYEYEQLRYQERKKVTEYKTVTKKGFFSNTKEEVAETVYRWFDVVFGYEEEVLKGTKEGELDIVVLNTIPKKDEWSKKQNILCSSVQELIQEYAKRKDKVADIDKKEIYTGSNTRTLKTYYYSLGGTINIKDHINLIINKIKDKELKSKLMLDLADHLYDWEYYGWDVYRNGILDASYTIEKEYTSDGEEIEKDPLYSYYLSLSEILEELESTKKADAATEKLLNQNNKLLKLYRNFDELFVKKYFDPYYKAWCEYDKKYGSNKEVTDKKTKAFKEVKKLLDKMFDVILEYDSKISLSSPLSEYIVKYNNFNKIYNLNQDRPTIVASKDTLSGKKLKELMKLRQQIINSRNAKLKEYYDKKEAQYQEDISNHILQMQKDMLELKKKLGEFRTLLDPLNLRYNGLQSAFKEQIKFMIESNKTEMSNIAAEYNKNLFNLNSDMTFKIVVKFRPKSIPLYYYAEVLGKSYNYEELLNKIKELVEKLNEKKLNKAYLNTTGKELYNTNVDKLKGLEKGKLQLNTYLSQLKSVWQYQQLEQLYTYRDYHQDAYTKLSYSQLLQEIDNLETQLKPLLDLITAVEKEIDKVNQEYWTLSQQCYYYEAQASDPYVQLSSDKYDIYDKKADLEAELDQLNFKLQTVEEAKTKQTFYNKAVMTTNQKYLLTKQTLAPYYEMTNDLNILKRDYSADGQNNTTIAKLEQDIAYFEQTHTNDFNALAIYEADLQRLQEDYLNNSNFINSPLSKNLKKLQQDLLKQLEEVEKEIAELEAPLIDRRIGITDEGVAYEHGYTFSTNGLYKNLYIDIQTDNEWLILRLKLKELYSYYNTTLNDGLIEEPKEHEEDLEQTFTIVDSATQLIELINDVKDECKCNWFIPMDFLLFGAGLSLPIKLTTKVYTYDEKGLKIPIYDEKGQATGLFMTLRRLMAVQNGYGYIFTGEYITMMYTGIPGPPPISVFISGVGLEYGAILAGGYVATTPYNIYLMKKYPYQNTDPAGQFYWLQVGALKDAFETIAGKKPILITFKIYRKFPLDCGFPKKCGAMTNEEYIVRGKCGLKDFFENTHDITTEFDEKSFNIESYMKLVEGAVFDILETGVEKVTPVIKEATSDLLHNISLKTKAVDAVALKAWDLYKRNTGLIGQRAALFMETKRNIAEWGNSSYSLVCNTWNVVDAMGDIRATKQDATQKTQAIIEQLRGDLFDLIPPECQDQICNTLREVKQDSIKDLGMSVNLNTKTTVLTLTNFVEKSVSDACEDLKDKAGKIIDGILNVGDAVLGAVTNFFTQFDFFSLTQYCPRRLKDITKDINPLKQAPQQLPDGTWDVPDAPDVFASLGSMIGLELIGSVMESLNNCVTRSITNNNIHNSSLFPEETRKYLAAANSVGDIANMAKGMGGYKMSLEDLFHEANRSSILSNFADIDTNDISLGYLTDFLNERGISNIVDTDKWLNQTETVDTLKNTLGKAFAGNLLKILKLKNGLVLSMNDQYKDLINNNLMQKTQEWSDMWSDRVNTATSIGLNLKGIADQDITKAWKNPNQVLNKLQNISNTMTNMMMKSQARDIKKKDELNEAFSESEEIRETKEYLRLRWEYLQKLTKQDYSKQLEQVDKLSNNI